LSYAPTVGNRTGGQFVIVAFPRAHGHGCCRRTSELRAKPLSQASANPAVVKRMPKWESSVRTLDAIGFAITRFAQSSPIPRRKNPMNAAALPQPVPWKFR